MLEFIGIASIVFCVFFTVSKAKQSVNEVRGQTVVDSLKESWTNIAIGFTINWLANIMILPLANFHITSGEAFYIGCIFTTISVVRSFIIRRFFNNLTFGTK